MSESRRTMPRWMVPCVWTVGLLVLYVIAPWLLSRLGVRRGWNGNVPGAWNMLGLVVTGAAFAVLLWCVSLHFARYQSRVPLQTAPQVLLQRGPYRVSRNPLYIADSLIVLGWAIFYGSAAVLVGCLVFASVLAFVVVPSEERQLTDRFGNDYLRYKATIPRWLGKRRTAM